MCYWPGTSGAQPSLSGWPTRAACMAHWQQTQEFATWRPRQALPGAQPSQPGRKHGNKRWTHQPGCEAQPGEACRQAGTPSDRLLPGAQPSQPGDMRGSRRLPHQPGCGARLAAACTGSSPGSSPGQALMDNTFLNSNVEQEALPRLSKHWADCTDLVCKACTWYLCCVQAQRSGLLPSQEQALKT